MQKRRLLLIIFFLFLFFLFSKEATTLSEEKVLRLDDRNFLSPSPQSSPSRGEEDLPAGRQVGGDASSFIKQKRAKSLIQHQEKGIRFDSISGLSQEEKREVRRKVGSRLFPILKKGRISPHFPGVNKEKATINLIVRLKEGAKRKDLEAEGIEVRTKTGNIATVSVKLSELNNFIRNENIIYIEPVKRLNLLNEVLTGSSIAVSGCSHLDTSDAEDNYTFSATSGQALLIRAYGDPRFLLDPYLELKDSSGNILAFDDNSGPGNTAEINWTFSSSGSYLIGIKSANPTGSSSLVQDYQLLLSSDNTKINLFDISAGDMGDAFYVGTNAKIFSNEGEGVIIGIVDTGIDYKHEDFIDDTTGESRILYIWDQTDTTGADTPIEYNYGSEWTQTQINNEIDGSPAGIVREKDTNGHGTHVAGIAAGDGSATDGDEPAGKYKGMAPKSELIIVKVDLTDDSYIIDGVNYIFSKAATLGKPAVVNLSLGTHLGPHDGTSALDQAMDSSIQVSSSESKGRVVVVAAGNEGSDDIHAEADISPGYSEPIKFFNSYGYLGIDTWHDGNDKYQVTFSPPSNSSLQDWEWGGPTTGPTSGYDGSAKCWGTKLQDNYRNDLTINLESPSIDLSGTTGPELTFKHWYKTESDWDGGVVKVSTDNGITWEKIYPEENEGKYPGYDVVDQELYTGFSLARDGAYSGDSSEWADASFDLSSFAGEMIIIKWSFHSDSDSVDVGWYIDDVEVKDGGTTILSKDFEDNDGSFTYSINNSLIAKPGTLDWEWLGDETGGVVHLNYSLKSCNNDYEVLSYNSGWEESGAIWQMSFQRTTSGGDGHLDAWMFGTYYSKFSDHVAYSKTVGEPGTASSVITVGAYTTKYMWDATDGYTYYSSSAVSDFGGIAYFSSLGPTRDERMKPDIVGPGFYVCSSLSSDVDFNDTAISVSYPYCVSQDDRHCLMAGTSMSSPAVVGATALLLSAENKTASEVKLQLQLLATSSLDKFTPSTEIPNDTYGYGKLTLIEEETESGLTSEEGGGSGGGCFIATAAFGTPLAEEVITLKKFRDRYLLTNPFGRAFTKIYYKLSPSLADFIRNKPLIKAVARIYLKPLIWWSRYLTPPPISSPLEGED